MSELKGKQADKFARNMLKVEKKMKIRTNVSSDYQDGYVEGKAEGYKLGIEERKMTKLPKKLSKKSTIKEMEKHIQKQSHYLLMNLLKYLYSNHRIILRDWEKTQGNLNLEFLEK